MTITALRAGGCKDTSSQTASWSSSWRWRRTRSLAGLGPNPPKSSTGNNRRRKLSGQNICLKLKLELQTGFFHEVKNKYEETQWINQFNLFIKLWINDRILKWNLICWLLRLIVWSIKCKNSVKSTRWCDENVQFVITKKKEKQQIVSHLGFLLVEGVCTQHLSHSLKRSRQRQHELFKLVLVLACTHTNTHRTFC